MMTNRHVAEIFTKGVGTRELVYRTGAAAIDFAPQATTGSATLIEVTGVRMIHPYWDMALLEVDGLPSQRAPLRLSVKSPEELRNSPVVVIGYPAQDGRNDAQQQRRIFHNKFRVKRLQPGRIRDRLEVASFENQVRCMTHDASTLGGNSGSAVIEVATGDVVGLHFGGKYRVTNYSVPMYELARDPHVVAAGVRFAGEVPAGADCRSAWRRAHGNESVEPPAEPPAAAHGTTVTLTIPIHITITIGTPVVAPSPQPAPAAAPPRTPRPDPVKTVANFLADGRWQVVMSETGDTEGVSEPLDPAWLATVKGWRSELATEAVGSETLDEFRTFFHRPDLTAADVEDLLAAMQKVIEEPAAFYEAMQQAQGKSFAEEGLFDTAKGFLHIPFWFPTRDPDQDEMETIAKLKSDYPMLDGIAINPHEHHFEVPDPGWWHLLLAKTREKLKLWPAGLASFIQPQRNQTFVYEGKAGTTKIALIADFGVGHYHSEAIARTLTRRAYPYVFHLGDVYYGGTQHEFDNNYTRLLAPVMQRSMLFSIPENHELYSGGGPYQRFLADNRASGKIIQEGSYFCVRFAKHQIVAVDVNWNGRQCFDQERVAVQRQWLGDLLDDGRRKQLTTILLTGSAPYVYGGDEPTRLFDDFGEYFHRFHMWFWGDDHYCALFPYHADNAPFVGSCIGHGGYPGDRQTEGKRSYLVPDWVETEPRFPSSYELRDDLTNNGWVELTMLDDGGVELVYVDWLACQRAVAKYTPADGPNGKFLRLVAPPRDLGRTAR